MKVLHIETGMHLYGGPQQVLYLLQSLQSADVENLLVCPVDSDIAKVAQSLCPVTVLKSSGIGVLSELWRILRTEKPDLVHVQGRRFGADVFGGLVAKALKIPAILSRRVDNTETRWLMPLKYGLYRKIIAISEGIRVVLVAQGMSKNQIITVLDSVDTEPFSQACDRDAFLQEFSLPRQTLTIAMAAQLIERKGHRYLFEALPDLEQQFPDLRVLLFGKGPLLQSLQKQVQARGLKSVQFVGFRADFPRWLGCIDVLVHPADREGLGVSLLQASAAGVPVVASAVGGIPEAIRHQENGLLIQPRDVKALQMAIASLLEDKAFRQKMGLRGREIVQHEFSVSIMARRHLEIYHQVFTALA